MMILCSICFVYLFGDEGIWDKDKEPKTCDKEWKELSISEQKAATSLGYNESLWDAESDDESA